jgi:predicted dehydrogenase
MPERMRVAVVGGGIGVFHINAYKSLPELYDLAAICDIDRAKAQQLATDHGIPRVTTDIADLCQMDHLDAIDSCTPPHLHYDHVQQVLAAGKHAICEKPLVSSIQQVDQLIAAEARAGWADGRAAAQPGAPWLHWLAAR